ncbi:MAG TPA: phage tail protein [Desulfitobacteriaceae bacterium]|jgi:phage tail-like protein|nr:phage tail protein [Desulfitobacteriaceae bacterium]
MKSRLSYFIFNKRSDYERGHLENLQYSEQGISTGNSSPDGRGSFISRVLDSFQTDMSWHRLSFDVRGSTDDAFKFTVYASNTLDFERDGELYRIDQVVRSSEYSLDEKLDFFEPYIRKQATGLRDVLLHEVVGRYLWIVLEIYSQSDGEISVSNIKICLPSRSWLEYLPVVYQSADLQSGFLDRYLGIFQTLYEDLNLQVRNAAAFFDADCADSRFLQWLSEWLDITDSYIWSEDKLRLLLARSLELYRGRGTKKSIEEIVELYTSEKPYIVETFQLEKFKDSEEYERTLLPLYGDSPFGFTVLVREKYVKTVREFNILIKIIEEMKPVQMELKLVVIKPYIFLNQYSYLGVNSVLGKYRDVSLDGSAPLTLAVINN